MIRESVMDGKRREYLLKLFPEVMEIKDRDLAEKVLLIWSEVLDESAWDRIEDVPKNPVFAGKDDKLIQHLQSTIRQVIAVSKVITSIYGNVIDMDVLIASTVLHDVCKLMEYEKDGLSEFGKLMQHGVYSTVKGFQYELPLKINHILLTHTKKSTVLPQTIEGIILHYVDYLDSDVTRMLAGKPVNLQTNK